MSKNKDRTKELSGLEINMLEPVRGNHTLKAVFKGLLSEQDDVTGRRTQKAVFLDCDSGKYFWVHPCSQTMLDVIDDTHVNQRVSFTYSDVRVERVTYTVRSFKVTID